MTIWMTMWMTMVVIKLQMNLLALCHPAQQMEGLAPAAVESHIWRQQ